MAKIAITMGDPTGIGPEIILKSLNELNSEIDKIILIGNQTIFEIASKQTGLTLPENIEFINISSPAENISTDSKESGELAFQCLKTACEMAKEKKIKAIATAPVSKNALNLASHRFSGQTEILEQYLKTPNQNKAEMLFINTNFKVIILTRHIPLKAVPSKIKKENIIETIEILTNSLKKDFKINDPKIALCALNPHSGENGLLGTEEIDEIIPAIESLNKKNIKCFGPFPGDIIFKNITKKAENPPYDCYVACYHDQGLIPVKMLPIEKTLNVTIGLPTLRTSPAHGTAFDIAGQNKANYQSMLNAIKLGLSQ